MLIGHGEQNNVLHLIRSHKDTIFSNSLFCGEYSRNNFTDSYPIPCRNVEDYVPDGRLYKRDTSLWILSFNWSDFTIKLSNISMERKSIVKTESNAAIKRTE